MENNGNNQIGDTMIIDRNHLFAFSHGMRLAIESLGLPFNQDTMMPILERMDSILANPKNSLVRGNDDVQDWNQHRELRELEKTLCAEYLKEVTQVNESETS